jgi:autotransporter-associated beta strand protein
LKNKTSLNARMNVLIKKSLGSLVTLNFLVLACAFMINNAGADEWPDVNGATAGSGITNNGSFSWEDSMWTVVSAGNIATMNWTNGAFIRLAASTDAGANNYTITANADHTFAGIFLQANGGGTVTLNGSGILTVASGFQGFLVNGSSQNLFIYNTLAGPGGVEKNSSGSLFLYGTNTYSGGTRTDTSGGLNFNNPYSFGTGPISWNGSAQVLACPAATAPIVLTNAMVTRAASQLIFVSPTAAPVTITGPWTNAAGTSRLTMNNAATKLTIGGTIYGATGNVLKDGPGTLVITGTNANNVTTTVTNGLLEIGPTGSIAGTVNVQPSAGVLQLDGPTSLNSSVTLTTVSSRPNSVNLNFSGTNTIFALYINGLLQTSGTWGALGSGANNENAIFTGTGFLKVPAAPVIVQEPQSLVALPQAPSRTFTVQVTGDQPSMTFQWKFNNNNLTDSATVSGSQTAQLTLFPPYTPGTYICAITNVAGFTNTLPATLTLLATNDYVNAVAASAPIAYWRLDETSGTTANDAYGQHQSTYLNANLNQPGFSSAAGSDPAIGLPSNASQKGYVVYSNAAPDFSFPAIPFTLEAWASSTNFAAKQRLVSTLTLSGAGGFGFAILDNQHVELTVPTHGDIDMPTPSALASGVWYHFVATCDGNDYTLYLNGNPLGTHTVSGFGLPASSGQLGLGNNPAAFPTEQLYGGIDEVAIYNYALDQTTVTNHYLARYSDQPAPTVTTPVVTPPTNYVSLSSTLTESAGGAGLIYQWYKGSGTGSPIAGGTDSTLTIGPLQLSDAANYHCVVTDFANHTADSPLAFLAVVPIPASASDLNLTNGLVLHLPFDTDYKDVSGRANNGTTVGSPALASGEVGSGAVHYGTTNGVATNYVTVGVVPDLQFGASTDFSVSYWVRGIINTNLPFFCDSTNGLASILTNNGGYYFGPDSAGDGGWAVGLGSAGHEMTTSGANVINDGNWHNLVHVAKRDGNMTTYLDGAQVDNHAISFITDSVDTTYPANIGQDGSGGASVSTQDQEGDIDDLGVWRRTLTPLEVSGIYLAGATNHVSFAPPVNPLVQAALQIVQVSPGQYQIIWTGSGTLQASGDVVGTYTNVPSGNSPYTIPISSSPQLFYRLKY